MAEITVKALDDKALRYEVSTGTTSHDVTVPEGLARSVAGSPEELVLESFVFLLEREPASSILKRFDLDVISHYFPEYPKEIRKRLKGR